MLPGDAPLLIPDQLRAVFQWPMRKSTDFLKDYEMGGLALGNAAGGLTQAVWELTYIAPSIVLSGPDGDHTLLSVAGVTELGLAFDFNMRAFVTYMDADGAHYWWYDSTVGEYVTSDLPADATHPRCCLDLRLQEYLSVADVLLAYQRGTALYYRQQRDRYLTEYLLTEDCGGSLVSVGATTENRVAFRIIP